MNKEGILARSRKEDRNERKKYVDSCGRRYDMTAMCIVFTVLAIFSLYQGQSDYEILALLLAYLGMELFGMYLAGRAKMHIVLTAAGSLAAYLFAACHAMTVMQQDCHGGEANTEKSFKRGESGEETVPDPAGGPGGRVQEHYQFHRDGPV